MPRGQYHWPPRRRETVYSQSRMDEASWPHGEIVNIERDKDCEENSEVLVMFKRPQEYRRTTGQHELTYKRCTTWSVKGLRGEVQYNDESGAQVCEDINHTQWSYVFTGEEYSFGGETELITYWFSDFEGNWDSSDGGMGRWDIE
jgi:hypothetical protein